MHGRHAEGRLLKDGLWGLFPFGKIPSPSRFRRVIPKKERQESCKSLLSLESYATFQNDKSVGRD